MRRNVPSPPPRPFSQRHSDITDHTFQPHQRTEDDEETEVSDNDSILAMAKRLDASRGISDPSFIEGTQPHKFGLDPSGFDSSSMLGHGHPGDIYHSQRVERDRYYDNRDLESIASNDLEDHSVFTEDDGSDSQYTEECMGRNMNRNNIPPPGVPRIGHHNDAYDFRVRQDYGSPGNEHMYQGVSGNSRMHNNLRMGRMSWREHSPDEINRLNTRSQSHDIRRTNNRSQFPNYNSNHSRSQSPSRKERGRQYANGHRETNDMVDQMTSKRNGRADTKRTVKLVAVSLIVLIVIAVSIGVVFVIKGGDDSRNSSQNQESIQIAVPTVSPTYQGEYSCPANFTGQVPTKGCLGYVQCNGKGGIEGAVIFCPSGTLFDASMITCSWEESVRCSTKLSTSSSGDTQTTVDAPSSGTFSPVSNAGATMKVGPIDTFNHRLSFQGILTLGDVEKFEKNMQNYINIFFSQSRAEYLSKDMQELAVDDVILNSLSDVKVDLTIKKFEWSGSTRLRRLQGNAELIMTYDQRTQYNTSDNSIKVGAVVRYPYTEHYEPFFIEYLQATDDVFESLSSVDFLESTQVNSQSNYTTAAPVAAPSTSSQTVTISNTEAPSVNVETSSPTTGASSTSPTIKATESPTELAIMVFPKYATIQGFMWIDENNNGLYETSEPPAVGTFANLIRCDEEQNNKWVQTTTSNDKGQYQFIGVEEGQYYVQFFRPSNDYQFTIPLMAPDDEALDSHVVLLAGESECMDVDSSFSQLINAGYILKDLPEDTDTTATVLPEADTFCAQITTTSGNQSFDFFGCSTRCTQDSDCKDDLRCMISKSCSQQDV